FRCCGVIVESVAIPDLPWTSFGPIFVGNVEVPEWAFHTPSRRIDESAKKTPRNIVVLSVPFGIHNGLFAARINTSLLCQKQSEKHTSSENQSDVSLPLFLPLLAGSNGFPGLSTERTNDLAHGGPSPRIILRAQKDDISKNRSAPQSVAPWIKARFVLRSPPSR